MKGVVLGDCRDNSEVEFWGADAGDDIAVIEAGSLSACGDGLKPGGLRVAAEDGKAVMVGG